MKVDYFLFDPDNLLNEIRIIEIFAHEGITLRPLNTDTRSTPCLLFFSGINPPLFDLLKNLSTSGHERILGIYFSSIKPLTQEIWRLLQSGASDIVLWERDNPIFFEKIAARLKRWNEIDEFMHSPLLQNNIIGNSKSWIVVLRQIVEVAKFTNSNILLLGESGTGKEQVARLIHALDSRTEKGNLVIVDCTTIVPELSGSEFFGHERGAFTGAISSRDGAFALANGGTLFLDEVGELPLNLQAQLLRVVQEHTYKRVGGNNWYKTEFRLICATNKNLLEEVRCGRFRNDLYYRIANWVFTLPPLRDRPDDIIPLAEFFIKKSRPDSSIGLDDSVKDFLLRRDYPGNVRELKQLIERIMDRYVGPGTITAGDIPEDERPEGEFEQKDWQKDYLEKTVRIGLSLGLNMKEIRRAAEDMAIRIAMSEEKGNLQRAAKRLGITDRALQLRRAAERRIANMNDK